MFPTDDAEFEETTVTKVTADGDGFSIGREDGFSFFVPNQLVIPAVGDTARFYGKGIGYPVRGLFLNGVEVFYRTPKQEREHHETTTYGADAKEWLRRWDAGEPCWSISMGGLGPSYEQAIQIMAAEFLRVMLDGDFHPDQWESQPEVWKAERKLIESSVEAVEVVQRIGCSGAQWGAAFNLGLTLFRRGPRGVMTDERVKDRHIQVSRVFPQG